MIIRLQLFFIVLCCLSSAVFAGRMGPFEITRSGAVKLDGCAFGVLLADSSWYAWTKQDDYSVKSAPGTKSENNADLFSLKGSFYADAKNNFEISEQIHRISPNSIGISIELNSKKGIVCNVICYAVALPVGDFLENGIFVNGKNLKFPRTFDPTLPSYESDVMNPEIVLPMKSGYLKIRGNFSYRLQDERKYNLAFWNLRMNNTPGSGLIFHKKINATMTLVPYEFHPVSGIGNTKMPFDTVPEKNAAGVRFRLGKNMMELDGNGQARKTVEKLPADAMKHLYLLHAKTSESGMMCGKIIADYQDGSRVKTMVSSRSDVLDFRNPGTAAKAIPGLLQESKNGTCGFGVSKFALKNQPLKQLSFEAAPGQNWFIAGMSFSNDNVPFTNSEKITFSAGPNWIPLKNEAPVQTNSILDFSDLLDKPAGKYGFLKSAGNRFEFEKQPGKRVRFYGGNIALDTNFMDEKSCEKLASAMASCGYNLVRIHHFDEILSKKSGKTSTLLDASKLDRLDALAAAMKRHGIYITLDLFILRNPARGEIAEFPDDAVLFHEFKALPFISESAMRSWEDFSRNLLTHVNPYTGLAWKDDPSIATISLINEDTLPGVVNTSPRVRALYDRLFEKYCRKKQLTVHAENKERLWAGFLCETYRKGYVRMAAFLKKMGVRIPLTDQNMTSTIPVALSRMDYDFVDNHFYWQHPVFMGSNWQPPVKVGNLSCIEAFGGNLTAMFSCRFLNKPFTVSEWDFVNPSESGCEGAL